MSRIAEFRQLEKQLASLLAELESIKNDSSLVQELEFEKKLRALMAEYGVNLGGVINLLGPHASCCAPAAVSGGKLKERALKVYINPANGERVEIKGGNHKTLKAWKQEFGADVVEAWLLK